MKIIPALPMTNSNSKPYGDNRVNYVKITGYGALGCGICCGLAGVNKKIKRHKYLAYASILLALVHTGLIEWYHYKRSKSSPEK